MSIEEVVESDGTSEVDSGQKVTDGNAGSNSNSNQNRNGGSNGSSRNGSNHLSGGTSTTEKPTATEQPATTEKPSCGVSTEHQHNWQAQYKTVHHDEEGHYENVMVQDAYDEPIYETGYVCNYCGKFLGKEQLSHCVTCGPPMSADNPFYTPGATMGSSYSTSKRQVDTKHNDEVYEKEWVVDKEAYDENVLTGYTCTTCEATKNN